MPYLSLENQGQIAEAAGLNEFYFSRLLRHPENIPCEKRIKMKKPLRN